MKLIIAGSRELQISLNFLRATLQILDIDINKIEIVSGGCPSGPDYYAKVLSYNDPDPVNPYSYKEFPADWDTHGKAAGPIRNKQMAEYADSLLLIWDGKSRGSANMKKQMEKLGKPVYEVILK